MISELAHYKHRCEEAERECTNLKKEMRQMESFHTLTKGIPKEMLSELRRITGQITTLRNQLDDQTDLEPYLSIGHAHGEMPTTEQLLSDFKDMKEQLASILVINGTSKPLIGSLYGQSADLDVLLRTVFNIGIQSNAEELLNASPELTLRELIQALTGAAIHCWVFESGGHEGLYNLDTAVHQSMIKEKDFKDVTIPRMASRHTTRLLNALQPLFDKQLQYKTARKLKLTLDCILRLAIQVRSLSLVGTEDYASIWPSPGSLFDNNEMETEHSGMATMANLVRLPLSPGLRAYPKENAMVGYHRFGNGEGTSRTPKYVIKALILI
ncbi:hypothetical protein K469DRAFT_729477 [Zopfia rhizophila CBS 207.26]|uniref:Uncharacterized protein n=1 Tax=Zopfia rhizophila CBS 207.26 TaxID=1314779 RepID=A0A6A6DUN1_9PEZI|nr:hypothetical protein K469DRAFT_729477 [Zopfia rhizophila CBS 207.26]